MPRVQKRPLRFLNEPTTNYFQRNKQISAILPLNAPDKTRTKSLRTNPVTEMDFSSNFDSSVSPAANNTFQPQKYICTHQPDKMKEAHTDKQKDTSLNNLHGKQYSNL